MIEEWVSNFNMVHLNQQKECEGTYTFSTKNGKSAIDHILVNNDLYTKFKGMHIDEDKLLLDFSDHCLVRAWFKINPSNKIKKEKTIYKNLSWIKKDQESYERFKTIFKNKVGKKVNFNKYMSKLNDTVKTVLLKKKRIKVKKKGNNILLAAKWVDNELIDNLKLKSILNRKWRKAKKDNLNTVIQEELRTEYFNQKKLTIQMEYDKKVVGQKVK